MLVTARGKNGPSLDSGVMGHATSNDLLNWTVEEPLSKVGAGFGETEVFQFEIVDGVPIVLFCCSHRWISDERKAREVGGVYSLVVDADLKQVDISKSVWFDAPDLYASRLVQGADGGWNLLGFWNEPGGKFVGELSDPIPVTADPIRGLIRR